MIDHETPKFLQLMFVERDELQEKINKLTGFIQSDKFKSLDNPRKVLLMPQRKAMKGYIKILNLRIDLEVESLGLNIPI